MSTSQDLQKLQSRRTSPVVVAGLIGGYASARVTKVRALGAVGLGLAGVCAARSWNAKRGVGTAAALTGIYLGAFGASHPLAKKIGAWPSVLSMTAVAAGAAHVLSDSKDAR